MLGWSSYIHKRRWLHFVWFFIETAQLIDYCMYRILCLYSILFSLRIFVVHQFLYCLVVSRYFLFVQEAIKISYLFKFTLKNDRNLLNSHSQDHICWCPDGRWSQRIRGHGFGLFHTGISCCSKGKGYNISYNISRFRFCLPDPLSWVNIQRENLLWFSVNKSQINLWVCAK